MLEEREKLPGDKTEGLATRKKENRNYKLVPSFLNKFISD